MGRINCLIIAETVFINHEGIKNMNKAEKLDDIYSCYKEMRSAASQEVLVELLRELQEVQGFIDAQMIERAAAVTGFKPVVAETIVKRYPSLKAAPYKHKVVVCTGRNCSQKGNHILLSKLKKSLGVDKNGISKDKRIYLTTVNCLRNCLQAPNIMIDGIVYSGLDCSEICDMLAEDKKKI
ncbi:NADH-quinone oxidoreductase subunit 2 [uncultured Roseburia sp.]|nr:NADH-quinone oxidoreductase subunit 2 [uncultured Roseburia sp.]